MLRSARDFWAGVIYLAFGAAAIWLARDYQIGTAFRMGPGYFPTAVGILLGAIGAVSLARAFIVPAAPIGRFTLKGGALVSGSVLLFGLIVRNAGLAIAVPALVIASGVASLRFRWASFLLLAASLTVFCWLVFLEGLGVPLPLLGPWVRGE